MKNAVRIDFQNCNAGLPNRDRKLSEVNNADRTITVEIEASIVARVTGRFAKGRAKLAELYYAHQPIATRVAIGAKKLSAC